MFRDFFVRRLVVGDSVRGEVDSLAGFDLAFGSVLLTWRHDAGRRVSGESSVSVKGGNRGADE